MLGILLQFLTEVANMNIHSPSEGSTVITPDRAQEFVTRDGASGPFHQKSKKLKLELCETNRFVVSRHLASPDIDSERAKFMNIVTQDPAQFYDDGHPPFWVRFTHGFEAEFSPIVGPPL